MAIVQISKIQQRSGNLVDLPQLDDAELGWANDARRLFIGKTTPNENVEILTSYSAISFSQIDGAVGNLNISNLTAANGQVLSFDGSDWVNRGGIAGGLLTLGDVSNVKIDGGAIGYVLQTDGTGNLSWTPKGTLVTSILNISKANPAVVTTVNDNFFSDGAQITILDPQGMTELAGGIYFANTLTSTTFALYTDSGFGTGVNSTSYNAYSYTTVSATTVSTNVITVANSAPFTVGAAVKFIGNMSTSNISNTATYYVQAKPNSTSLKIATSADANAANVVPLQTTSGLTAEVYQSDGQAVSTLGSSVTFSPAGGTDTTVQFNASGSLDGSAAFTFNSGNGLLTLTGNANVGNLNATGVSTATRFISNVATGTPPLQVTSLTRVANLSVAYSNVSDFGVVTTQTTGTFYPVFVSGNTTANYALASNANISVNAATGNLSVTLLNVTSNANVGNLGTAGLIIATGNVTGGNLTTGGVVAATGNVSGGNLTTGGVVAATGNVTGGNLTTGGVVAATGNVSGGNLTTGGAVVATGNVSGGNLTTAGAVSVTGNVTAGNVSGATGTFNTLTTPGTTEAGLSINAASQTQVNTAGRTVSINASPGNGTADGGGLVFSTGNASTTGIGGRLNMTAGNGAGAGAGGNITLTGGRGGGNSFGAYIYANGGLGNASNTGGELVLGAGRGNGTNTAGGNITVYGGIGTGTGQPGNIIFQTTTPGSTGTATQSLANRLVISGNVVNVTTNVAATSTTSGALVVVGGMGVGGNVYAGAFYGSATGLTAIPGAEVSGAVAFATTANAVAGANVSGTVAQATLVMGATQNNITTLGALTTLSTGANTTAGTITGNWSLSDGSRLTATYADLAEYYEADVSYEPGTVLMFGGEKEVTLAEDGTSKVAGVVSTNPAYVMNATCPGLLTAVALQGRVPCKVRGKISKGDMLISGGNGFARPNKFPSMGTVIGKALQDFDGYEGVIEVAVGRL
jgi:hypothetical protein